MDSTGNVSLDVSSDVSLGVSSRPVEGGTGKNRRQHGNKNAKSSSPGKYLVRSGSVYLFQIRMPEDIGGSPARILRIGLGALTARQARVRAELLAALARERFEQLRIARMKDKAATTDNQSWTMFDSVNPEIAAAEVKGYLKAMQVIISQPAPPTPPHQEPAFAGIRGLVALNRELAKGADANPLIVDNAEILKEQSILRFNRTVESLDGTRPVIHCSNGTGAATGSGAAFAEPQGDARAPEHATATSAIHQPRGERILSVVPPADSLAPSSVLPQGTATTAAAAFVEGKPVEPAPRADKAPSETARTAATSSPVAFAIPASSIPMGPSSDTRIYRDETGKIIPAHRLDRRTVHRKVSNLPKLSEIAEEYFDARAVKVGTGNKDLQTARKRLNVFLDLIGDHPVDTYSGADLQAYIALMTHWPALARHRPPHMTPWEILASNADLNFKPLKRSALEDGYVSIAKTVIGSRTIEYGYANPLAGVKLRYPDTAAPAQSAEPLSTEQLNNVFRAGIDGGLLDEAMLPLLGNLTGRRLGLLVHLTGNDIRQKYPGVWVAQTSGIVLTEKGVWKRVPIKTDQSTTFFVLHDLLREIGFIDWAQAQGDSFLFPTLTSLKEPSKQASTYMQRLFRKAGITGNRKEVFHSLRGGHIEMMRDNKVDARDRRLQAGHKVEEEHDLYGFKVISEKRAREIAQAKLMEEVDYSMFYGLNFEELSKARRTRGRRPSHR